MANRQTAMKKLLAQLKDERANIPMDIEWVRCYQAIEMVIQNTYLPIEKEQIKEAFYSGYEDRDKFKHSDDYYDKMYERNDWQGILFLGEVDGVKIYYDSYHPDQTLSVELNKDKTEMVYIIGPYDDISVFDGIKKNIIVSEKPTNMIKPTPELQDPYSPTAKWITTQ
jgi:hypothetical protein